MIDWFSSHQLGARAVPATSPILTITGISELRRDLRKVSRESRKALDKELRKVAKPIADAAKRRYRRAHPRRGRTRGSQRAIRATRARGKPAVALGNARTPYLLGQEWGSSRFRQFPPRAPEGSFFWPAVVQGADQAHDDIVAAIDRATKRAFPGGR